MTNQELQEIEALVFFRIFLENQKNFDFRGYFLNSLT